MTDRDALRGLTREEAVEKALLHTFQLSGKDYRAMQAALSEVAFIRALEQDGYTVAALAGSGPEAGLREALERLDLRCENYVGSDHRPRFDGCGANHRPRGGEYGSDQWCLPCEVRAALAATRAASPTDRHAYRPENDDGRQEWEVPRGPFPTASPTDHEHYWVDAPDDETGWHCTICGLTEYPGDPGIGLAASPTATGEREP